MNFVYTFSSFLSLQKIYVNKQRPTENGNFAAVPAQTQSQQRSHNRVFLTTPFLIYLRLVS